jgi:hypothetical protein
MFRRGGILPATTRKLGVQQRQRQKVSTGSELARNLKEVRPFRVPAAETAETTRVDGGTRGAGGELIASERLSQRLLELSDRTENEQRVGGAGEGLRRIELHGATQGSLSE